MKLAIIFPVMNQLPLSETAIGFAVRNLSSQEDNELIILDNASNPPVDFFDLHSKQRTIRLEKNMGVYPLFWEALRNTDADVLAFFHSDLIIDEKDWDRRVMDAFIANPNLWLMGFIGSNEIDAAGGRGLGTTSNFIGGHYFHHDGMGNNKEWQASPARVHGAQNSGLTPAAVVDGCAMIFRRTALEQIAQRPEFPPHHFYDRLLSSEVREKGFDVSVLGIGCDHISGQTVNQEPAYGIMAEEWALSHGLTMENVHNWDTVLYREAERLWLTEYRDVKKLVPCRI